MQSNSLYTRSCTSDHIRSATRHHFHQLSFSCVARSALTRCAHKLAIGHTGGWCCTNATIICISQDHQMLSAYDMHIHIHESIQTRSHISISLVVCVWCITIWCVLCVCVCISCGRVYFIHKLYAFIDQSAFYYNVCVRVYPTNAVGVLSVCVFSVHKTAHDWYNARLWHRRHVLCMYLSCMYLHRWRPNTNWSRCATRSFHTLRSRNGTDEMRSRDHYTMRRAVCWLLNVDTYTRRVASTYIEAHRARTPTLNDDCQHLSGRDVFVPIQVHAAAAQSASDLAATNLLRTARGTWRERKHRWASVCGVYLFRQRCQRLIDGNFKV